MTADHREKQNLAERLATVLRRLESEGGSIHTLSERIGQEPRDLRRWADGAALPGHVLIALLHELPRHLSDYLIAPTGLRLIAKESDGQANALKASAVASEFAANVAVRASDGVWCHQDEAATRLDAARVISSLQPLAGE